MAAKPASTTPKTLLDYLNLSKVMAEDMSVFSIPNTMAGNPYVMTYLFIRKAFLRCSSLCFDAYGFESIPMNSMVYVNTKRGTTTYSVENNYLLVCLELMECVKKAKNLKLVTLYDSNELLYKKWEPNPKSTAFEYAAKSVLEAIYRAAFWLYNDLEALFSPEQIANVDKLSVSSLSEYRKQVVSIVRQTWPMPPWSRISIKKEFQTLYVQLDYEYKTFHDKNESPDIALKKSVRQAFEFYKIAIGKNPHLNSATDKEVYDWMKENFEKEDLNGLNTFDTWNRYIRDARQFYGTNKNIKRNRSRYLTD